MSDVEWLQSQWAKNRGADITIATAVTKKEQGKQGKQGKQEKTRKACEVAAEWINSKFGGG